MTPRFVPVDLQRLLELSSAGVAVITFIVVTHPQLDQPVNLVIDDIDYEIDGALYHRANGVKLKPVTDTDAPPRSTFAFPNVDYSSLVRLENVVDPARVSFFYAASTSFDRRKNPRVLKAGKVLEPFWAHQALYFTDVVVNEASVSGTLRGPDYSQEQWPNLIVTQELLPGAYLQ